MSREKKLAFNTMLLGIGEVVPMITGFITLPIYTMMLTKAEYGTYDLINILIVVGVPVVTLQIQQGAFRFMVDCREDPKGLSKIITNVYAYVVPALLLALMAIFLAIPGSLVNRIFTCLYIFIETVARINGGIIRGFGMNKEYTLGTVINAVGSMVLAVLLLYILDMGLTGLLLSLFLARMISVVYIMAKSRIMGYLDFACISRTYLWELLRYSIPMVINALQLWVVRFSDRVVITVALGLEMNAVYAVANKIPTLLNTASGTFNTAWRESASIAVGDDDFDEYCTGIFTTLFRILAGGLALLIAGAPLIFAIFIKGSYEESYLQMPILFMAAFFSCLSGSFGVIYIANKITSRMAVSSFIGALLNLVINIAFVQKIGLYAASISTLVSYMVLSLYRMYDIRKLVKIRYRYKEFALQIVTLATMCLICSVGSLWSNILNLIIGTVAALTWNRQLLMQWIDKFRKRGK